MENTNSNSQIAKAQFPTKKGCLRQIFHLRALKDPHCINCGYSVSKYYKLIPKRKEFGCSKCRHKVSPLAGTPFQNTKIPLNKWIQVLELGKAKDISPKVLHYDFGISHKTAIRMLNVIAEWRESLPTDDISSFFDSLPPLFAHARTNQ